MNNKASASAFLRMVVDRQIDDAYERFIDSNFIHHNQFFKGDRASLKAAMHEASAKNPEKILEIKKVVEEGDEVVTLSHVRQRPEDSGVAVVHIFRFKGGKVVELWDLGQPITENSVNENGIF